MSTRPPAVNIMRNLGLEPDPWQVEALEAGHPRLLLNCCRQAGKSTAVAMLALAEAVFIPHTKVLLLSRSLRQSTELFRIVTDFYRRLKSPLPARQTRSELELANFSRIVCLPCQEETIRGYSHISLLIIDEAARVPDDLYRAVRPMLAVSNGRMICLSTPYGKRGFFYDAWAKGGDDWARIEIPAQRIARISPDFLAGERRSLGESWFRQEYCCSFEALEGLVYPDFARAVVTSGEWPVASKDQPSLATSHSPLATFQGRKFGGIDFGFRNPFAAVWGVLDKEGVLWLTGEHYQRQRPVSHHADHLPRDVYWYADPSGANERAELLQRGLKVVPGVNDLRPGIGKVTARLETGTLKVLAGRCPNLLAEAQLYRYSDDPRERLAEFPLDEHNHALAALRYLIMGLDARGCPRSRGSSPSGTPPTPKRPWLRLDNEALWTPL
ncbi:MAG TPA: terminase family protein [Candidatus Acidoferrales bacterium]|nr:terminase family protein [Candidatus Acidoferrales bacterium]